MKHVLTILLISLLFGSGQAFASCTSPQYVDGASYAVNDLVQNVGKEYRCDVAGWCSLGGAYEPGVGWAWSSAWTEVATCGGSSSGGSSGGSCVGLTVWDSGTAYVGGSEVQYNNVHYRAQWWTQGENPETASVWENLAACGGGSSGGSSGGLPAGINSQDIGNTVLAGSASHAGGTYTVNAGGADVGGTTDAFHFVYGDLSGDGEVTANIESVTEPHVSTKVGLMLRSDLTASARNAYMLLHPSQGSAFQYRSTAAANTSSTWTMPVGGSYPFDWKNPTPYRVRYLTPAKWLKLIRESNTVTAYSSDDGLCWNIRWRQSIDLGAGTIHAGIALTSHNTAQAAVATVSDLQISNIVPSDVNAQCQRAQRDNTIAAPTQWLVTPKEKGGNESWYYTTTDPNPVQHATPCLEGSGDRRNAADDTICPLESNTLAWVNTGFDPVAAGWQSGSGSFGPTWENSTTVLNSSDIWLHKVVNLTTQQINDVMFWGRWSNSASIYVNGVLATNVYKSGLWDRYHYLGLNSAARTALQPGNNVIAIRVSCVSGCNLFTDIGMGLNASLANPPRNTIATNPTYAARADAFYEYSKEMAAMGGAFAVRKNGAIVEHVNVGWADTNMQTQLPVNAVMRLASVDKRVTEAAIVKLYNENKLSPNQLVFGPTGILPNVTPVPGGTKGNQVELITVDHLRNHRSGISALGGDQSWLDEQAFKFGVSADQLDKHHYVRLLYSANTEFTPGNTPTPDIVYSSNGYFLLRYIIEVVEQKSLNNYLAVDMGATDVLVSSERLAGRHINEPDYHIIGEETYSRWVQLEEYLAISASVSGLTDLFSQYAASYREDNYAPKEGGQGGGMKGTRSGVHANLGINYAAAQIWNSDFAGSTRWDRKYNELHYNIGPGSCNPGEVSNSNYAINSAWSTKRDNYLHMEDGQTIQPDHQPNGVQANWHSAYWQFVETADSTPQNRYYIIKNLWQNTKAMHMETGSLLANTAYNSASHASHWELVDMGSYYRIRNRQHNTRYINIEGGTVQATALADSFSSTHWYVCNAF